MTLSLEQVLERSRELTRADRHQENLTLLSEALERHPDEPELVLTAATAYFGEDEAQTERLMRHAVELAPDDPTVLTRAGFMALDRGFTDDALAWSRQAYDHADDDFPFVFDLVHLGGRIALARENAEVAERLLRLAFDNQPESFGHGRFLAALLESQDRYEEALEVVEETRRHWPDDRTLEDMRIRLRVLVHGIDTLPPGYTVEYE